MPERDAKIPLADPVPCDWILESLQLERQI